VEIHGAGPSQPIEFKYNRSKIGAVLPLKAMFLASKRAI
jgi:hypothetical protein